MKSTGEVLGIADSLRRVYISLIGAGYKMKKRAAFITVQSNKAEIGEIAKKYYDLGFNLCDRGTAEVLKFGIDAVGVKKFTSQIQATHLLLLSRQDSVCYFNSARRISRDSVKIRRKTLKGTFVSYSLDTANALADCLKPLLTAQHRAY